ncbi:3D/G5 protein, partial [human gut metagenome]
EQTFVTYKGTVQDVLNEQGIKVEEKDSIKPALNEKVQEDSTITLKKAVPIKIVCGNSVEPSF